MVFQPDFLKGRAALVTGGGTGICRGIALALAAHGCDVAIASRKAAHVEPTAEDIRAAGVRALALVGDVRDPESVERVVGGAAAAFGRLDIVVNGAAGNFICAAEALSPNGFGTVVDIDLKGTFNVSRAALAHLKVRGGSIINISATLQYLATLGQIHASAAKAGVDVLTRTLAAEWGGYDIRVNGIAPGAIRTPINMAAWSTDSAYADLMTLVPYKRIGEPDDIAQAAVWLASDASDYVTGATLFVDGGMTLYPGFATGG